MAAGRRGGGLVLLAALGCVGCGGQPREPPALGDIVFDGGTEAAPALPGAIGTSIPAEPPPLVPPTAAPTDDPTTCDQAASLRSYVGCDFWPTVVANGVWSIFDFAVVVANAGLTAATVRVTGPMSTDQMQVVPPNALAKFYLPWVSDLKGPDTDSCGTAVPLAGSVLGRAEAYHLVSSVPVSVYQFSALEYAPIGGPPGKDWSQCPGSSQICIDPNTGDMTEIGCFSYTNDSSLLLPSTAMTGHYRVTTFPGQNSPDATGQTAPEMNDYFAITATANDTHVTVSLSTAGQVLPGSPPSGIAGAEAGGTIQLTLNAGDVAELAGALGNTIDLSGSLVVADQPVQVIAGAPCDQVPETAPACDHLEQSVFPAETLGKRYFIATPTGPLGVSVGHVVRLYGNVDGTLLTYAPATPAGCPTTLNAGQVVDCGLAGDGFIGSTDFEVTGNYEFAVATFMLGGSIVDPKGGLGDPSESLVASVEQFRTKYVFLAPNDYRANFIDIVTPTGATITLDATFLDLSRSIVIADGYEILRVPLAGVNPSGQGAHVLTASVPVGLQVLGYGEYTSYQYPGGLNLNPIAPAPLPR
jgi:hypothetical protein